MPGIPGMVGRTSMWMAMGAISCWIINGSGRSRRRAAWISVVSQAPRLASRRGALWPNRFWMAGLSGRASASASSAGATLGSRSRV